MAGPIGSAFVELKVRLNLESGGALESQLRTSIAKVERDLEGLEGVAAEAGAKIGKALGKTKVQVNTREAVANIIDVDDAAQKALSEVKDLQDLKIGLNTTAAKNNLKVINERVDQLARSLQIVDDNNIDLNVGEARKQLEVLEAATNRVVNNVADFAKIHLNIDVSAAQRQLDDLGTSIGDAIRKLNTLDKKRVNVKIDDLKVDQLEAKVKALDGRRIKLEVDARQAAVAENALGRVQNQAGDFSRAFRRILAFGAIREATQLIGQLFQAGVQAAGEIQNVQVSLNRFFAQSKDLGQTSTEFFANLRDLALRTPFEFKDLAETSRRVLAMGEDAKGTVGFMTELSDAVAAVGGGQGEIDGIVRALSQLSSKGKVDLQDFRQISENLPSLSRQMQIQGVVDELNDLHPGLNAAISDFEDLRKSGLITGKVLRDGVIRAIGEIPGVTGAAEAASRTLQGALSNLRDFATQEFARSFQGLGGIIADELNAAFGSLTNAETKLTPFAVAIRDVIDAFGRAGESALPLIFDGIVDVAPELSALVNAFSSLVDEVLPTLTNLTEGALTGLTGMAGIFREMVEIFNVLPDGVQQAVGQFAALATIIPGAGESLKKPFLAMKQLLLGVAEGEKQVALGASVMGAAITAGLLVVLQVATSRFAKASQRNDEYADSVDMAAEALKEFADPAKAAVEFVEKFRKAGEGVNLGGLEQFFDGLTTGEISDSMGITVDQLAALVQALAQTGGEGKAFDDAMAAAGISAEDLARGSDNAQVSVAALADQYAAGAKEAFEFSKGSKEFAFVTDDQADAIERAAKKTGDYVTANKDLKEANNQAAKAAISQLKAQGATNAEIDTAIGNFTTYTREADGSVTATTDFVGALQQLTGELAQQDTFFQQLGERFGGFSEAFDKLKESTSGELAGNILEFSKAAEKAGFSSEELNAVANELGDTLGRVLTGEELGKVFTALGAEFDKFKGQLEGVVPTLSDLQLEADGFSLNKFIEELNKIAEARNKVTENINIILDRFGLFGASAIDRLSQSGLTKDQFAIALEDIVKGGVEGGSAKIGALFQAFGDNGAKQIGDAAQRMVELGFSPAKIETILGADAFGTAVGELDANVAKLDPIANRFQTALEKFKPRGGEGTSLDDLKIQSRLGALGAAPATASVPAVDVAKETKNAAAAGDKIGKALTSSVKTAVTAGIKNVQLNSTVALDGVVASLMKSLNGFRVNATRTLADAGDDMASAFSSAISPLSFIMAIEINETARAITSSGTAMTNAAGAVGRAITVAFANGVDLSLAIRGQLAAVARLLTSTAGPAKSAAFNAGHSIGQSLVNGISAGITAGQAKAASEIRQVVAAMDKAARLQAQAHSPSQLFAKLGDDIGAGLTLGLNRSLPSIVGSATAPISSGASVVSALAASAPAALSSPAGAPAGAQIIHYNTYHIVAPTDDPESLAQRVQARMEDRLDR